MVTLRAYACVLLCLSVVASAAPALAGQHSSEKGAGSATTPTNGVSIAVADFSGVDKELGRILADTLLTDLSQSDQLRMVERSEIGKVLTELKLQSTGLAEPQDVKKVGNLLGADRLIVGSYLVRDNQLLINARMLDLRTGRVTQGGAANVEGNRDNVLLLVHQLAHRFHKRLTGNDLILENEIPRSVPMPTRGTGTEEETPGTPPAEPRNQNGNESGNPSTDIAGKGRSAGGYNVRQPDDADSGNAAANAAVASAVNVSGSILSGVASPPIFALPGNVLANRAVSSFDMTRLLVQSGVRNSYSYFTGGTTPVPVSRVRALAALLKASGIAPSVGVTARALSAEVPDAAFVPTWAAGYVDAALKQHIWPAGRPLYPTDAATWGYVNTVTGRLNNVNRFVRSHSGQHEFVGAIPVVVQHARNTITPPPTQSTLPPREEGSTERSSVSYAYTGLLIEARGLPVQRTMSPRIVDTNGEVLYPDPHNVPDIDYLQDHGMADYYYDRSDTPRVGARPLIVRAIAITGDDLVVNDITAARIREMNRRDSILRQWRVGIVLDRVREGINP